MGEVKSLTHIPEARRANKAEVAHFFGIALPTVDKWINKGCPIVQRGTGKGIPWVFDLLEVALWKHGNQQPVNDDAVDPEKLLPKDRKDWFDSELKRDELLKRRRELIHASEVERVISTSFSTIAQNIRSIPDKLERKLGIDAEVAELVSYELENYLHALAISLEKLGSINETES